MKKGDITPDTLGMIIVTVGLILLGFLMFVKTTTKFIEGFVAASAKVVAMDLASLMSLSRAAKEVKIEYEVPTETVKFRIEVKNNYVIVQRIDESYCKEEEQKLFKKIVGEKPISEQEFCKASEPVLFTYEVGNNEGKKFIMEKVSEKADLYVE